jgi:hypothetical protein
MVVRTGGPQGWETLELDSEAGPLRFFTVAAQLETPMDSVLQGLHLETFVPADERTRLVLDEAHPA